MKNGFIILLLVFCASVWAIGRPVLSVEFGGALNWLMEDHEDTEYNEFGEYIGKEAFTTTPYLGPVIGLACEASLADRFVARVDASYQPLSSELKVWGIPYDVSFPALSVSLLGGYCIWRDLSFELGPQTYVVLGDFHYEQTKYDDIEFDRSLKQNVLWGAEGGVSYAHGPWSARLHYTHTFTETEEDSEFQFFSLEARSLALTIAYRFYAF